MTVAEFLKWEPDDPTVHAWQLIEGEPVAMAPAADDHGSLQNELGALLRNHLLAQGRGCRAINEPGIVPGVRRDRNFRIPDIGVTCARSTGAQMVSDPILLVEILSPSNETETWANIGMYQTIPSVQEIPIIDRRRIAADLLRRAPDGSWPETLIPIGPGDDLELSSIEYSVPPTALYRTTSLA